MGRLVINRDVLRYCLPYGMWVTEDGRAVLFARGYRPIWQRRSDEAPRRAKPFVWISDVATQVHFYDDSDHPDAAARIGCAVLTAWGVPLPTDADVPADVRERRGMTMLDQIATTPRSAAR